MLGFPRGGKLVACSSQRLAEDSTQRWEGSGCDWLKLPTTGPLGTTQLQAVDGLAMDMGGTGYGALKSNKSSQRITSMPQSGPVWAGFSGNNKTCLVDVTLT